MNWRLSYITAMLGKHGTTLCRLETTAHPLVKSPTLRVVVVGRSDFVVIEDCIFVSWSGKFE